MTILDMLTYFVRQEFDVSFRCQEMNTLILSAFLFRLLYAFDDPVYP